jgi:signal transduction histidine kinase
MAFSTLVSTLAIRQVLLVRLQEGVERSFIQQVEEFRRLTKGRNPTTAQLFGDDVVAIFNVFLSRNIPGDDEFFIALLNGKFYQSSPEALPASLRPDSDLVKHWAKLTEREQGKKISQADTISYLAEPVIKGKTHGVFVVAHSNLGDSKQVDEAVVAVIEVTMGVLAIASVLAWVVAGQVLAPLRLLTETAQSISESDLTRRIPVQGADEIAELTITFNEMLDRLQTAFASQRDFINDASHELRTPITIIRGHLELLGDDPQERRETVELVTDELDRMSRFVDDLLLLAKAEQPNFLTLETVDIGLLTEELYTKARALGDRDWRLENKGMGRIVADRQRLTQAMMNLAQNATQHTTDSDVIALGSAVTNGYARLWVRDTGEGITLADQRRIFERFARGSLSRRRSEGAGLGLSIVRAIAIAHGGQVELKSRPGGGATFTIVIPLDPCCGGFI